MGNTVSDVFKEIDFYEIHKLFLDNSYYEILFPFLIVYAIVFTALHSVKVFKNKDGKPIKPVIVLIAIIAAIFSVKFEISEGQTTGGLMMVLFPNISALTIGILSLYIVGSMLGQDFFRGLFRKDHSAYIGYAVGVIGLGSVIYYVGISMGFFDADPLNPMSMWNTIIAVGFFIMGITFLFIDLIPFGLVLLLVFASFVYDASDTQSILTYFIDPVMFIIIIMVVLFAWMNGDKKSLDDKITTSKNSLEKYLRDANMSGGTPGDYEDKIHDIMSQSLHNLEERKKKLGK